MKLTLIHPCLGRIPGRSYVRSWQMEPLPPAYIAALTPRDVEVRFYDDRLEPIPYDEPTDLVAISVETYTAKRAYQIASEYRRRGVPVAMGGFHASLRPEEVLEYAEIVVAGEAEEIWPQVIEDFRRGTPRRGAPHLGAVRRFYRSDGRARLGSLTPDRSIFAGKRYLGIGLIEGTRGCSFRCDFCAVTKVFGGSQTRREIGAVLEEIRRLRDRKKLFFFVDDNIASDPAEAREFYRALAPLGIRWVSQASITAAKDEGLLRIMHESGCQAVLVGFESMNADNLRIMNKSWNQTAFGYDEAVARFHRHRIRLYGTFVFGYGQDTLTTFAEVVDFCIRNRIFMAAFNHLTPFPNTPLYDRLEREGRLLYDKWWLDERYHYGQVPFRTALDPRTIQNECVRARKEFYGLRSIVSRLRSRLNWSDPFMLRNYWFINLLLRHEATQREDYPLGDLSFRGPLEKVDLRAWPAVELDPLAGMSQEGA